MKTPPQLPPWGAPALGHSCVPHRLAGPWGMRASQRMSAAGMPRTSTPKGTVGKTSGEFGGESGGGIGDLFLGLTPGGAGGCSQRTPNPDIRPKRDTRTPQRNADRVKRKLPSDNFGSLPAPDPFAFNAPRSNHFYKSRNCLMNSTGVLHSNSHGICVNA